MSLFFTLFAKIVPLALVIVLGFFAGKFLHARKETVASLLIYTIAPVVVFDGVLRTRIDLSVLSLPVFFLLSCSLLCLLFYALGSLLWHDAHRNILAFTAGTGNTGYFGLPMALALLGEEYLGPVVLALLGFILYESTLGFFITARGNHTVRESLLKVLKPPTLYAFFLGLLLNSSSISLGETYTTAAQSFRGTYSVLGMMIVGMGIASMGRFAFDVRFLSLAFLAKFVVWPLWIALAILLDRTFLNFYHPALYKVMVLMAIVPLAANTVAFATELDAEPEKASLAVALSTLFALFYIPFVVGVFF